MTDNPFMSQPMRTSQSLVHAYSSPIITRSWMQLFPTSQTANLGTTAMSNELDIDEDAPSLNALDHGGTKNGSRSASRNLEALKTVRLSESELSPETAVELQLHDLEAAHVPKSTSMYVGPAPTTNTSDSEIVISLLLAVAVIQCSQSLLSKTVPMDGSEWAMNIGKTALPLSSLWFTTQLPAFSNQNSASKHSKQACQVVIGIALLYCALVGPQTLGNDPLTSLQPTLCFLAAIFATRIAQTFLSISEWVKKTTPLSCSVLLTMSTVGYAILLALTQLSAIWMDNALQGNPSQDAALLGVWASISLVELCAWLYLSYKETSVPIQSSIVPVMCLGVVVLSRSVPLYAALANALIGFSVYHLLSTSTSTRFTSILASITLSVFTAGFVVGQLALSQLPMAPHPTPFLNQQLNWKPVNIALETTARLQSYVLASAALVALLTLQPRHNWKRAVIQLVVSVVYTILAFLYPSWTNSWNEWEPAMSTVLIVSSVQLVQLVSLSMLHRLAIAKKQISE